jgi:HEPN domain-containing protein
MADDNKIKEVESIYRYWLSSSDSDYEAMMALHQSKKYNWALFLGHIVLEKLIKAYIVKVTGKHAPYTHDLRLLTKKSGMDMPHDMVLYLDVITGFNINARYDTFKEDFYKKCTPEFTAEWIENIKTLRLWIKKML